MKRRILQSVSGAGLVLVTLPSVAYLSGSIGLERVWWLMLLGTLAWFVATPLWMERKG